MISSRLRTRTPTIRRYHCIKLEVVSSPKISCSVTRKLGDILKSIIYHHAKPKPDINTDTCLESGLAGGTPTQSTTVSGQIGRYSQRWKTRIKTVLPSSRVLVD